MKELLRGLLAVSGGPGQEASIAAAIRAQVQTAADEVYTDILGNLYAVKQPQGVSAQEAKTVLLIAPMDEPALVITDVSDSGHLRVEPLGQLQASALIGARVRIGRTGRLGVVGVEGKVDRAHTEFLHLFIDIHAEDSASASAYARVGDTATFAYPAEEIDEHTLIGHALASRSACAVLIEAFVRAKSAYTIVAVFSAQREVGSRGAHVAAYRVQPDLAVAIDVSPTGDLPESDRIAMKLGGGVGIKALDSGMVVAPGLRDQLTRAAQRAGITSQVEVSPRARSEAGAVFLSRAGVPTCGVAIPLRHMGTLSQMVDLRDMHSAISLLEAFLQDL